MHGKWKKRIQEGTGTSVGGAFYFIRKAAAGLHGNRISKENQKEKPDNCTKKKQEMGRLVWTFTTNRDIMRLHVKIRFTM